MENLIIHGKEKDLGGFSVYRVLPNFQKRSIGPFVFLDHMGPMTIDKAHALDVRPHPHIGLATVTYLFQGKVLHRDSLGNKQLIEPGDLNWMTAGSGIVHSERTPKEPHSPDKKHEVHGVQIWVALPKESEDCDASFNHYDKSVFPEVRLTDELTAKLLVGKYNQSSSPVLVHSPTFFMVAPIKKNINAQISFAETEIGIFIAKGSAKINGVELSHEDLIAVDDPKKVSVEAEKDSILIFIGGEPLPEKRFMWWNFVSSSSEKIRIAAERWKNQEMGKVAEESDFIPLPNDPLPK
ncbi:MAG: pirin family protein [Pseudobdellovibrio sp.]